MMNFKVGDVFVTSDEGDILQICRVTRSQRAGEPGRAWVLNGHWTALFNEDHVVGAQGRELFDDSGSPISWHASPPAGVLGDSSAMEWAEEQFHAHLEAKRSAIASNAPEL